MVEGKRQYPFSALPRVAVAGAPSGESAGARRCAPPPPETVWAPAGSPAGSEVRRGQMGSPPVQECAPLLLERAAIPETARKQDSWPSTSTVSGAAGLEGNAAGGSGAETAVSPVTTSFSPPDAAAGVPAKCWRTFSAISSLIELEWDCLSVIPRVGRKSRIAFAFTSSFRANSLIRM